MHETCGLEVDIKAFIDARKMSPTSGWVLGLCFLIVTMDGLDTAVMGFVAARHHA